MTNPPINVPVMMMESLNLILVAFRDRRSGIRRILEAAEILPGLDKPKLNVIYKWRPGEDKITKQSGSWGILERLEVLTGMRMSEIEHDLRDKESVLRWVVKNKITNVNDVGRIIASYYTDSEKIVKAAKSGEKPSSLLSLE